MRYGDGGGVDQASRVRREQVRQRAAAMFDAGMHPTDVAAALEVSTKSGYQWHRAWKNAGAQALASKGPPGPAPKLSQDQVARLEAVLAQGAVAAGYDDERWTLARVVASGGCGLTGSRPTWSTEGAHRRPAAGSEPM